MKTLAVISTKGGSGKSTVAINLAAYALSKRQRVGVVDVDPQGSIAIWCGVRGSDEPLHKQLTPAELPAFRLAVRDDLDLLVIDTPPAYSSAVQLVASAADFVIIPCRPQLLDIMAIRTTIEEVAATETPAAILLNCCQPGRGGKETAQTLEARDAFKGAPIPVAKVSLSSRVTYSRSLITGLAAHEHEPESKAAGEIGALWKFIKGRM